MNTINKKTILIVSGSLNIGGVEKAIVSLLNMVPQDEYDITLMLIRKEGDFLKYLPDNIKIVTPCFKKNADATLGIRNLIKEKIKNKNFISVFCLFIGLLLNKFLDLNFLLKYLLFEKQSLKFDYIFNFSGPNTLNHIICKDVYECTKKFIWVHNEFSLAKNNPKKYQKIFNKYDYIFAVSEVIAKELCISIPKLKNKVRTLYNIIDKDFIVKLSNNKEVEFKDNFNGLRILSVGRLHYQKGFDIAIKTCKILIDKGYNIKWYILGQGEEKENLDNLIEQNSLEEKFVLLGAVANPYPFFKDCDIYVQTSRFEGYCLTLAEAKIFNKPIVTTLFAGAKEQIEENKTGIIVETNPKSIADGIEILLKSNELREKLCLNLSKEKKEKNNFLELKKYL